MRWHAKDLEGREEPIKVQRQGIELFTSHILVEVSELFPPMPPAVSPSRAVPASQSEVQKVSYYDRHCWWG